MKRLILLLFLSSWGSIGIASSIDLDSPFEKILLLKNEKGEIEKKTVKQAHAVGMNYEAESRDGRTFVIAQSEVVACLPLVPADPEAHDSQSIRKAIQFLESVPPEWRKKADIGPKELVSWDRLLKSAEVREVHAAQLEKLNREKEESEKRQSKNQNVQKWLEEAMDYMRPRSEKELGDLKVQGERLLKLKPDQEEVVKEYLAVLSQVVPKEKGGPLPDLEKLKEIEQEVLPDEMLIWFAGGIYLLSFFLLLFGLSYGSNVFTCLQSKHWIRGGVYGVLAPTFLLGLYFLWWPAEPSGQKLNPSQSDKFRELDVYLKSRNKPIYYLPKKDLSLSVEEFLSGVLDKVRPTDKLIGYLKGHMGEGELFLDGQRWAWKQGVSVLGLPMEVPVLFEGAVPGANSWENPRIERVWLGKIKLPVVLSELLADAMISTFQRAIRNTGLQGLAIGSNNAGTFSIGVPSSGLRPPLVLTEEKEPEKKIEEKKPTLEKEMSAEELAQFFINLEGKSLEELQIIAEEIKDTFILLDGIVAGTGPTNFGINGKYGDDSHDDIYLIGKKDYYRTQSTDAQTQKGDDSQQHLNIKCQIKSDWIFWCDPRNDLYAREVIQNFEQNPKASTIVSPKNIQFRTLDGQLVTSSLMETDKERPLVQRGKRLKFKKPLRLEINLAELKSWASQEKETRSRVKGGNVRQVHFSQPDGSIELYGLTLKPGNSINDIIEEVDFDYKHGQ